MKSTKKILFIIPTVDSGGIEMYVLRFLTQKKNLNITVLVRSILSGDLYKQYEELGIPLHFMPLGYLNPLKWWEYYRFFRLQKFDTICDFNGNFAGIPMWLGKMSGIKNRIAFYRQGTDHFPGSLFKILYNRVVNRLVYKHSTRILSNSQAGIDFFFPYRKRDDKRFKVIHNGVDLEKFNIEVDKMALRKDFGIPEGAFVVGHTGRLNKAKNHDTILKVARQLISWDSDLYFVLCGRDTEKLAGQVEELGISANVRLLGYQPNIPSILQIFDVFYFPSITEGQPNSLIEAMIAGLPIVTSDISPIKEVIPVRAHPQLLNPLDVDAAILVLKRMRRNQKELSSRIYKKEATEKFNSIINFGLFLNEL